MDGNTDRPAVTRMSAAIMTHPTRIEQAGRLATKHPALNFSIACDPEPGQPRGSLRTSRLAWSQVTAHATHHLVIQDDVLLHPDFDPVLEAAVSAMPDRAIAFFSEWGSQTSYAIRLGALAGAGWVEAVDWYVPSLALVLPADAAREFDSFAENHRFRSKIEDDDLLYEFLRELGIQTVIPVPNWAEHADGPSLAGNDSHGLRKATVFLPEVGLARNPEILCAPKFIPSFSWVGGFPYAIRKPGNPHDRWSRIPIEELLLEHGLDSARTNEILREAGRPLPNEADGPGPDARRIDSMALCAIALGASAAYLDLDIHAALRSPVAQGALATMVPGGLRRHLPARNLPAVTQSLSTVIPRCVALGYLSSRSPELTVTSLPGLAGSATTAAQIFRKSTATCPAPTWARLVPRGRRCGRRR